MNILLYAKAFHPMVGGIETVTATMAELFNRLGHHCEVLTPVENSEADTFEYKVHRRPGFLATLKLVWSADVVVSKGASLAMVPFCLLAAKPFIWIHSGYQASCIDGLGWVDGEPAPMTPWASIKFHYRRSGLLFAAISAFKLFVRRFVSKYIVEMNVAVSDWVAMRQPFKRQIRIHNPFPVYRFAENAGSSNEFQFMYLGRLVSEKGVETLIDAFGIVKEAHSDAALRLLIIGDGNWREVLEAAAARTNARNDIIFVGRKTGRELVELVQRCEIAVVPSEWEEPMGGVALELLAAGKLLIASRDGGVAECVGDAALLFDNGDEVMLAERMESLLKDETLRKELREQAKIQVKKFDPERLARRYIELFEYVLGERKQLAGADPLIRTQ